MREASADRRSAAPGAARYSVSPAWIQGTGCRLLDRDTPLSSRVGRTLHVPVRSP
jgi:hypothetical protein